MVPGFVQLGLLAVGVQLLFIAGFYRYLRWWREMSPPPARSWTRWSLLVGVALLVGGQLLGFGAVWAVRVVPGISIGQTILVQNVGVVVMVLGMVVLFVGFVLYSRAGG